MAEFLVGVALYLIFAYWCFRKKEKLFLYLYHQAIKNFINRQSDVREIEKNIIYFRVFTETSRFVDTLNLSVPDLVVAPIEYIAMMYNQITCAGALKRIQEIVDQDQELGNFITKQVKEIRSTQKLFEDILCLLTNNPNLKK